MKVVKTKYYEKTGELIPLDPQPVREPNGEWNYERKGNDELGDFVVIDFITEEPVYLDYDTAQGQINTTSELKITTEEEWLKPATLDIASMDIQLSEDAPTVDASILEKSLTTDLKMNQATSQTVIEKLMQTIGQLYCNVLGAIKWIFRK